MASPLMDLFLAFRSSPYRHCQLASPCRRTLQAGGSPPGHRPPLQGRLPLQSRLRCMLPPPCAVRHLQSARLHTDLGLGFNAKGVGVERARPLILTSPQHVDCWEVRISIGIWCLCETRHPFRWNNYGQRLSLRGTPPHTDSTVVGHPSMQSCEV